MKMLTSELRGEALDWAVAQVEKPEGFVLRDATADIGCWVIGITYDAADPESWVKSGYSPSIEWSQGGPLIEKYRVGIYCDYTEQETITANVTGSGSVSTGLTFLIAACRAIVTAYIGDEIDVPDTLV